VWDQVSKEFERVVDALADEVGYRSDLTETAPTAGDVLIVGQAVLALAGRSSFKSAVDQVRLADDLLLALPAISPGRPQDVVTSLAFFLQALAPVTYALVESLEERTELMPGDAKVFDDLAEARRLAAAVGMQLAALPTRARPGSKLEEGTEWSPKVRLAMLRRLARDLASVSEAEVDAMLRIVKTQRFTPRGWSQMSLHNRRDRAFQVLDELSNQQLAALNELSDTEGEGAVESATMKEELPLEEEGFVKESNAVPPQGTIFVVHGHALALKYEAVRVLERGTGRDVVVLHELPNAGRTILEKFEGHAATASFAVVLLTADDEGGVKGSEQRHPRGRQNVIFELGFFCGKLGRERVVVLLDLGVEKPSDIDGLVYIPVDPAGAWKHLLAKELVAAKIDVDYSRIP
jgi:predicted nucleotide-binding protein